jgi:hypothetical protein
MKFSLQSNKLFVKQTFAISLLIYSLTLLILICLLPLNQKKYTHSWSSSIKENKLYIPLVEQVPENVTINIPCEVVKSDDYDWLLEFRGGTAFQVFKDKNIGVLVGDSTRSTSTIYNFEKSLSLGSDCMLNIQYAKSSHSLQIDQGTSSQKIELSVDARVEILNHILINPNYASEGISLLVETVPPSDVSESNIRKYIHLNFLIIFISYVIFLTNKQRIFSQTKNISRWFVDKYFVLTFIFLITLSLILPQNMDDGWRITEASLLKETGIYNNYIVPSPLPTGRLHAYINSLFLSTNNFALMRLPSVILLLIIWLSSVIAIKKLFGNQIVDTQIKKYVSFIIVLYSSAFLIGLRGEIYIASLLSLSFLVIIFEEKLSKINTFCTLLVLTALAISIHQSGLSVAVACLFYAALNLKKIFTPTLSTNPILIIAICVSGLTIFYTNNLFTMYRSMQLYSSKFDEVRIFGDVATLNPLAEINRLLNVFSYGHGLFTFAALLLFASIVFLAYILSRRVLSKSESYLVLIMLASFLAIFLMPSKWAWYYMIYLPMSILGLFFFLVYFLRIKRNFLLILLPFIPLVSVLTQNLEYELAPIVNINLDIFYIFFRLLFGVIIVLILLFIAFLSIQILFKKSKNINYVDYLKSLNLLYFLIILILVSFKTTPLVLDSLDIDGNSFIKQNISFKSSQSCGIFSELGLQQNTVTNSLDDYPYVPCFKPLLFEDGVWNYPEYIIQSFNILDQQRLGFEIIIEKSTCFTDYSSRYENFCVFKTAENFGGSSKSYVDTFSQF